MNLRDLSVWLRALRRSIRGCATINDRYGVTSLSGFQLLSPTPLRNCAENFEISPMDRVCKYSTILFAGNVTVLIVAAITTDYWQHRSFDFDLLIKKIDERNANSRLKHQRLLPHHVHTNRTKHSRPVATDSYLILHHRYIDDIDPVHPLLFHTVAANFSVHYEPPILLQQHFIFSSSGQKTVLSDKIYLFREYGSLFRDCLAIEGI